MSRSLLLTQVGLTSTGLQTKEGLAVNWAETDLGIL